jgi:hypothetical protein
MTPWRLRGRGQSVGVQMAGELLKSGGQRAEPKGRYDQ